MGTGTQKFALRPIGPVDLDLRAQMGNRIYGCDDCLAACPWNKFAQTAQDMRFHAREDLTAPKLAELAMLKDAEFRQKFSGSPIKRIGRDRFVRNVLYQIFHRISHIEYRYGISFIPQRRNEYRDDCKFVFQEFLRKEDLNPTTFVLINPELQEGEITGYTFHQLISTQRNENTDLFHTLGLLNTNVVDLVYRIE